MIHQVSLDEAMAMAKKERSFSATIMLSNPPEEPRIDTSTWAKQRRAVYNVMRDGRWRSLWTIAYEAGYEPDSIPAIYARITEIKNIHGIPHEIRRPRDGGKREYKLVLPKSESATLVSSPPAPSEVPRTSSPTL